MYAEAWTSGEKSRELSTAFRNYGDVWVEGIPLLAEEGRRDSLIEAGAPGAKREPDRAKPLLMVSSAKRCAGLTTPSAPLRWLRDILLRAQPPPLRGGEYLRHHSSYFFWNFSRSRTKFITEAARRRPSRTK